MSKRFEQAKRYTEKYKARLLPCRWCGSQDIRIAPDRTIFPAKDAWSVVCSTPHCDCSGTFTSVRAAIKNWNENQKKEGKA